MTVLCLIEQDADGGVADVSLRALTFARSLAAPSVAAVSDGPPSAPESGPAGSSMYQTAASSRPNGTSTAGGGTGVAGAASTDVTGGAGGVVGGAGGVTAVLFGDAAAAVPALTEYGVGDAYAVELAGYAPQAWARALAGLAAERSATAVVAAGTDHGSEVMAHLGAITGLPMAANCASAAWDGAGKLTLVRHRWAGSLLEDAVLDASPALLTVAVDAVAAVPASEPAAPKALAMPACARYSAKSFLPIVMVQSSWKAP